MRSNRIFTVISFAVVLVFLSFSGPMAAEMESVEGTIQGFNCVSMGTTCPVDKIDAHVASEKAFVVLKEGGGHYLIGNLDRGILGRHITKMVRISGHVDHHIGAIYADSLEIKKGDKWKKVWTMAWEQEEMYRQP